ncbi:unnamed protein product, partial [Durusdinium trenchii]
FEKLERRANGVPEPVAVESKVLDSAEQTMEQLWETCAQWGGSISEVQGTLRLFKTNTGKDWCLSFLGNSPSDSMKLGIRECNTIGTSSFLVQSSPSRREMLFRGASGLDTFLIRSARGDQIFAERDLLDLLGCKPTYTDDDCVVTDIRANQPLTTSDGYSHVHARKWMLHPEGDVTCRRPGPLIFLAETSRPESWESANARCAQVGGVLASNVNSEQRDAFRGVLEGSATTQAWTGLRDSMDESWTWQVNPEYDVEWMWRDDSPIFPIGVDTTAGGGCVWAELAADPLEPVRLVSAACSSPRAFVSQIPLAQVKHGLVQDRKTWSEANAMCSDFGQGGPDPFFPEALQLVADLASKMHQDFWMVVHSDGEGWVWSNGFRVPDEPDLWASGQVPIPEADLC